MITKTDIEFIELKESKIDFVEQDESTDDIAPIRRPIGRIAESIQIFTPYEMYEERAKLALDIKKAKQDLKPEVLKLKVQNLKDAMRGSLKEMERQHKLYDDELIAIEKALDLTNVEKDWNVAKQKQLAEEKAKEEANIKKAK